MTEDNTIVRRGRLPSDAGDCTPIQSSHPALPLSLLVNPSSDGRTRRYEPSVGGPASRQSGSDEAREGVQDPNLEPVMRLRGPTETDDSVISLLQTLSQFSLDVVQQPLRARMVGKTCRDHRPIDPVPVIRLACPDNVGAINSLPEDL